MSTKIEATNKALTSFGGLTIIDELITSLKLEINSAGVLPKHRLGQTKSCAKLKNLILGFCAGTECLDDMDTLNLDPGFQSLCAEQAYTSKSYGNFLRSFSELEIQNLQTLNIRQALEMRAQLGNEADNKIIFDIDSTKNYQHGVKMEGVLGARDNVPCLDTQNIFDELGFQYLAEAREGKAHSANGAPNRIQQVIRETKAHQAFEDKKIWVRADSGYYGAGFINACVALNADVLLAVRKDASFWKLLPTIHNWKAEDTNNKDRIRFYDDRECEIGSTNYRLGKGQRRLRYVVIRALKAKKETPLFTEEKYDYFAFCTSLDEVRLDDRAVVLTYRKRGNAENFIRESKNGFDMKHYPCQKLTANKAYGLIAQQAYNLMRFIGLKDSLTKTKYSKKIRKNWIHIPGLVARTGREKVFRMMNHHAKEVLRWIEEIKHFRFGFYLIV